MIESMWGRDCDAAEAARWLEACRARCRGGRIEARDCPF
jgi:hypothetical protein